MEEVSEAVKEEFTEPQYELIQSFTLTEDTKTIELSGFDLDKFALYINAPVYSVDGGCRLNIYKGEAQVFTHWANSVLSKSAAKQTSYFGRNENGLAFIGHTAATSTGYLYVNPVYVEGNNPFTKITFVMSAEIFPTGTKFELWGIRR